MQVRSLASLSELRIWDCRELSCRLAAAVPIQLLAWELPHATDVALKKKKKGIIPTFYHLDLYLYSHLSLLQCSVLI